MVPLETSTQPFLLIVAERAELVETALDQRLFEQRAPEVEPDPQVVQHGDLVGEVARDEWWAAQLNLTKSTNSAVRRHHVLEALRRESAVDDHRHADVARLVRAARQLGRSDLVMLDVPRVDTLSSLARRPPTHPRNAPSTPSRRHSPEELSEGRGNLCISCERPGRRRRTGLYQIGCGSGEWMRAALGGDPRVAAGAAATDAAVCVSGFGATRVLP